MRKIGLSRGAFVRATAGVGALFVLPSCGALAEAAIEQVAEEATGVEIDEDDGTFSIENDDISISLDTDDEGGSLNIESSDGTIQVDASQDGTVNVTTEGFEDEEDQELTFTTDADVPDGFPLPFPDRGTVESGSTFDNGDTQLMAVSIRYEASKLEELISFYDDYFEGDETVTRHDTDSGGERIVGYIMNPDGQLTAVSIIGDPSSTVLFLETTVGG